MLTLYQFPISHFCEKIRWALDYKRLNCDRKNLLPGLHVKTTKKLASKSSVPLLVHDGNAISNSSDIITYLDENFPQNPLTPTDEAQKQLALQWEEFVDREIGIHVRRLVYHYLLDRPDLVIPLFAHQGPWYGRPLLKVIYLKVRGKMRTLMNINDETAHASHLQIRKAAYQVNEFRNDRKFIVGDRFTRADLSAAALLAPLCEPAGYGLDWPANLPTRLREIMDGFGDDIVWVNQIYDEFRCPNNSER